MADYPEWICTECGDKHGRRECGWATWHEGTCGVFGETKAVTGPRKFGHLKENWKDE